MNDLLPKSLAQAKEMRLRKEIENKIPAEGLLQHPIFCQIGL